MEDSQIPSDGLDRFVLTFWRPTPNWSRLAIAVAWIACSFLFWHGAKLFNLPTLRNFDGSLLCDASPIAGIIVTLVLLLVCTLLGTVIAGAIHFEAGFFAAALAMAMISVRSGTLRSVIHETGAKQSLFSTLAIETAILGILLAIAWAALSLMKKIAAPNPPTAAPKEKINYLHGFAALAVQILATGIVICILSQTEAKNQALASVFIASIVGSIAAHTAFPAKPAYWYWSGPLIVGIIAYTIAATGAVTGIATGNLEGTFAALVRPLPIDYASVGPAGAILGYWMARGWSAEAK